MIIANESQLGRRGGFLGAGVFQYKDQKLRKLKDPKNLLADVDSVAVTDDAIYVADGAQGKIFQFTDDQTGTIFKYNPGKLKKSIRFKPLYRDLQGIALDNVGNIYVVTADSYDSLSFMPSYVWLVSNFKL